LDEHGQRRRPGREVLVVRVLHAADAPRPRRTGRTRRRLGSA
jgi:hypothetical protein